jgi:cellulose synthase/poly-beta-1,6-N-acetylglucosamine synthase-like glycosyltransferase
MNAFLEILVFSLSYLVGVISIINFFTMRTAKLVIGGALTTHASITILAPMRNEEANVIEFVDSIKAQMNARNLKTIIINDGSTDFTSTLLAQEIEGSSSISVIETSAPRQGWLGKVSALQDGYEKTDSEFIITLDADVRLEPYAVAAAITQIQALKLDYISPYPRQIAGTFAEKLIQPLLHWSWMSTVILRLAEKFPRKSTAVANGQFFVIRKSALEAIGGFESVSHKVLDDIELARALIGAGQRGVVTEGSALATTRMYNGFDEIRQGYGKSLSKAFGGPLGSSIAIAFLVLTGIAPALLALNGYLVGWIAYFMMVFTRQLSAMKSRGSLLTSFLHPLSSALLIYLIVYSWIKRGKIQWKGRTV